MRSHALSAIIAAGVLLAGCAQGIPPLNFSVPNVGPSATKIPAEAKSITVSMARPDEQTGQLRAGNETIAPYWKTSLEEALNKMAIFQDDAPKKVSLSVKVLKLDVPGGGSSMTTDAGARYELIDRSNGAVIFTTDINTSGTTPADFAFLGLARARESVNRAVQNNILQFLQALQTVNIDKPMFPPAAASPPIGKPSTAPTS
jgi:hypothetical protein